MTRPATLPTPAVATGTLPPGAAAPGGWRKGRLPGLCVVCRSVGCAPVCDTCRARHAVRVARCPRCALAWTGPGACGACSTEPPPYDAALACVDYAWPWDRIVTRFKFHGATDLARLLADDLAETARDAAAGPLPELLLPVPLAAGRLAERGANQAWLVARRVGRRLGVAAAPTLLLRIRETAHQLALPPEARAGNVRGAFALDPLAAARVQGRDVAVVDDVMTTGHTLGEIATLLKRHGARRVRAWAWARTPRPSA